MPWVGSKIDPKSRFLNTSIFGILLKNIDFNVTLQGDFSTDGQYLLEHNGTTYFTSETSVERITFENIRTNILGNTSFSLRNNDQEILLSLGSPMRSLALIDLDSENNLVIIESLEPTALKTGVGFVYGKSIDWNNDGYDEIISFSPEGNVLKIQPYYNRNGRLVLGDAKQEIITGINGLIPMSIIISDWDLDGFKDVLLPFQSGHVIAMTLSPATVAIDVLPIDAGPLSDMSLSLIHI